MKNYILLAALLMSGTFIACKKKTTTTTPTTPATACNGMNLCFKMDGTLETHNATWKVLSDRYRLVWEEGSGTTYKNIEIDIYTTATGTYNVVSSPASGKAGFQYYIQNGNKNIQGESGTITISNIGTSSISGTFSLTAKEGTTTHQVTEGNFVSVPK